MRLELGSRILVPRHLLVVQFRQTHLQFGGPQDGHAPGDAGCGDGVLGRVMGTVETNVVVLAGGGEGARALAPFVELLVEDEGVDYEHGGEFAVVAAAFALEDREVERRVEGDDRHAADGGGSKGLGDLRYRRGGVLPVHLGLIVADAVDVAGGFGDRDAGVDEPGTGVYGLSGSQARDGGSDDAVGVDVGAGGFGVEGEHFAQVPCGRELLGVHACVSGRRDLGDGGVTAGVAVAGRWSGCQGELQTTALPLADATPHRG